MIIKRPEDCSRDELLTMVREMRAAGMQMSNRPTLQQCPFCFGTTQVPLIKIQVKESIVREWHTDVTQEQWDQFVSAHYSRTSPLA